jgi:hypothetical protein
MMLALTQFNFLPNQITLKIKKIGPLQSTDLL